MNMKGKILGLAAMMAAVSAPVVEPSESGYLPKKGEEAPNGNSRRTHKQNVKRRRLRRLKNKAKQAK